MKSSQPNLSRTALARVPVRFESTQPTAVAVCVAGAFNDWLATAKARQSSRVGNGWQETDLAPGACEYRLRVIRPRASSRN